MAAACLLYILRFIISELEIYLSGYGSYKYNAGEMVQLLQQDYRNQFEKMLIEIAVYYTDRRC